MPDTERRSMSRSVATISAATRPMTRAITQ
jgi:hypothetical protein